MLVASENIKDGFSIFGKLIEMLPKPRNTKINFSTNNSDFQAWESHQDNKISPLMWIYIFSNCVS